MKTYERVCEICASEFSANSPYATVCSSECRSQRERETRATGRLCTKPAGQNMREICDYARRAAQQHKSYGRLVWEEEIACTSARAAAKRSKVR